MGAPPYLSSALEGALRDLPPSRERLPPLA